MKMLYRGFLLVSVGVTLFPNAYAQSVGTQDARSPTATMLAQTCAGCHGTEGYTQGDALVPLAGMSQASFIHAMNSFADNSRPSSVMGSIARNVTADEIKLMADYFASFPENSAKPNGEKS
jgi:sulfide dehydrogenase cytochrome subunit